MKFEMNTQSCTGSPAHSIPLPPGLCGVPLHRRRGIHCVIHSP